MINTDNIIFELLDSDGKLKGLLKQKIEKAIVDMDQKKIAAMIEKGFIEGISEVDFSEIFDESIFTDMVEKLQD